MEMEGPSVVPFPNKEVPGGVASAPGRPTRMERADMDERRPRRSEGPTTLYRMLGAGDELLYVGIAGNPGRRFEQHAKSKTWWAEVERVKVEHFPDRASALIAEAAAIQTEAPKFNHMHNNGRAVPLPDGVSEPNVERDRLDVVSVAALSPASLVGSFFHSFDDADPKQVEWQGCVVAEPVPGVYLIENFSWFMGESTHQRLVRLEDMAGWVFYDTVEWMNNAYEARYRPRHVAG